MPPLESSFKFATLAAPAGFELRKPAPLAAGRRPRHLAVILDGNGRWATAKGLPRLAGHVKGVEAVREIISGCLAHRIEVLSLYAFSAFNWRRPADEVRGLMGLFQHYLASEAPRLKALGIRLRLLGEREQLPLEVKEALGTAEALTSDGTRMALNLAVNYGGREEIVGAVRRLGGLVASGQLDPQSIDARHFEAGLFTRDLPPVDLMVRTAGERRISNFLLWQSAYAELLFMDVLWPDFTLEHLDAALADYATRRRTFGGLVDQVLQAEATGEK